MTFPCQRRSVYAQTSAASIMRAALLAQGAESELFRSYRLLESAGYLRGFKDCAEGLPFDPSDFDLVDGTAVGYGLPTSVWLYAIPNRGESGDAGPEQGDDE